MRQVISDIMDMKDVVELKPELKEVAERNAQLQQRRSPSSFIRLLLSH
jgi:hypothetical protein